ncbi:restriction endonuclease subunit S [Salinicoccus luteus]|uniref:restriction endonuclease subunit S n=1 Tax=Salinicoccus luteus TaxID=367840 RepID=UPI00068CD833|nr:restriction endonuclease subunit S [Salinicoccus luteus]
MSKQNVPELRFPEFSGEWEERKLEEIMSFSKGKGISKSDLSDEGASCVLYGELYTKYNEEINEVHSKTNLPKNRLKYAFFNDVLIPSSGETSIDIATASSVGVDNVLAGGDINILTPKEDVKGHFVSLMINGKYKFELAKYAQGKTVVHLYNNDIKKLEMKYPSIEEQDKISALFTKLNRLIELEEKKLELLEEQKKGYMQKIFSQELRFKDENGNDYPEWQEKKLKELSDVESGKRLPKGHELTSVREDNVPYISVSDMTDKYVSYKNIQYLSKETELLIRKYKVKSGDLIISIAGTLGKVCIVDQSLEDANLTENCNKITNYEENISQYFLYTYLKSNKIQTYINREKTTSSQPKLALDRLRNFTILVPKKEEQIKISNLFNTIDKILERNTQKLTLLKIKKKSLLQKMFI